MKKPKSARPVTVVPGSAIHDLDAVGDRRQYVLFHLVISVVGGRALALRFMSHEHAVEGPCLHACNVIELERQGEFDVTARF